MPRVIILSHVIFQQTPGLVGHHVALLWRGVTFGVRRDDEAGRQASPGANHLPWEWSKPPRPRRVKDRQDAPLKWILPPNIWNEIEYRFINSSNFPYLSLGSCQGQVRWPLVLVTSHTFGLSESWCHRSDPRHLRRFPTAMKTQGGWERNPSVVRRMIPLFTGVPPSLWLFIGFRTHPGYDPQIFTVKWGDPAGYPFCQRKHR